MESTPTKKHMARGLLLIGTANVLAGLSYPAQKLALDGLPAAMVCALRNLLALLLMAIWIWRAGTGWGRYRPGEWLRILFLGSVAYGLPLWLGIVGVRQSSAANGSILILLEPVTIVLMAWLLLGEGLKPRTIATVGLGLAGATAMVFEGGATIDLLGSEVALGNLWLALHGILWGFYTPVAKPLMDRGHDPVAVSALSLLASLALLIPLSAMEWGEVSFSAPSIGPAIGWTVFLAVTGSFAATLMWLFSLRWITGAQVAATVFLQPLAGGLVGVLLMGERLSPEGVLGAGLIAAGVLLTAWPERRRPAGGPVKRSD